MKPENLKQALEALISQWEWVKQLIVRLVDRWNVCHIEVHANAPWKEPWFGSSELFSFMLPICFLVG